MILTDEELKSIYDDHRDQMVSVQLGRSVEAAVLAKIASGQGPVAWLPMETAPKDGTLIRLLVQFTDHSFEDDGAPNTTIGSNTSTLTLETEDWKFAGWCWTSDVFTQGEGVPLGWLPLHATAPSTHLLASGQEPADLDQIIDAYLEGYVFEGGDDGSHTPNEGERLVIKDAFLGLLDDPDWDAAWR
jgi:hypothetical protein